MDPFGHAHRSVYNNESLGFPPSLGDMLDVSRSHGFGDFFAPITVKKEENTNIGNIVFSRSDPMDSFSFEGSFCLFGRMLVPSPRRQ